jgi:chromosomal replication initiation ATPase DnaA
MPKRPIEELIEIVARKLGLKPGLICSGSRKPRISDARSIIAHMAVEETGHSATDVARYLGIKQTSVLQSVKKGRILSAGLGQDA